MVPPAVALVPDLLGFRILEPLDFARSAPLFASGCGRRLPDSDSELLIFWLLFLEAQKKEEKFPSWDFGAVRFEFVRLIYRLIADPELLIFALCWNQRKFPSLGLK